MVRIITDFDDDGNAVITVEGAKGEECYQITKSLERKGKVVSDKKTEEYYERESAKDRVLVRR